MTLLNVKNRGESSKEKHESIPSVWLKYVYQWEIGKGCAKNKLVF